MLPSSMLAAILVEQKKPLIVDRVELPTALDVGQVLIKIAFSGICGSQLGEIDGAKGDDRYLPHLLGHEASGVVKMIGPGVCHVAPGDPVVLHWRPSQGIESRPPKYSWQGSMLNAGLVATFNEFAIVSENRVTKMPAGMDMRIAPLFGCAITTGLGVVENNAKILPGESVVVFGAGGVGLNIIQGATLTSAYPIIAVDIHDNRLALAKKMGATHVINARGLDVAKAIMDVARDVDVFIDNTGDPSVIEMGYAITRANGRVVLVGVPRKGKNASIYTLPLHFGKVITGSHGGEAIPHRDIPRYQKLVVAGKLDPASLITEIFPLRDINQAIARMRDGSLTGRCLIQMD